MSSSSNFCQLHVHSEYSSLDGACKITELVKLAKEMGHSAVGLSDHGTMSGLPKFYLACKDAGIRPVLSCEIYLTPDRHHKKRESTTWHLGLIARTTEGYHNLCQITSRAFIEGYFNRHGRADWEILEQHSEGIIALTGCMAAPVMSEIFKGNLTQARANTERLISIFGAENVYGEIQNVGIVEEIPADSELAEKIGGTQLSQTQANRELAEICADLGLKLVGTGDVHYLRESDAIPHDALVCVGTGQLQSRTPSGEVDLDPASAAEEPRRRRRFSLLPKKYYFRSEAEMREALPEWPEALANTVALAERCEAEIPFGQEMLPSYPVPEEFKNSQAYLRHLCEEGMVRRYGPRETQTAEQRDRLEFELGVIHGMGFDDYFLIVWDFVNEAQRRGIPSGPGRGSAAGSIVAYSLGVTKLDPLRFGLLFERFLNPDRISMPDIDWDVSIARRMEIIEYVREKYNTLAGCETSVSQIITHGTIGAKAGLRDATRVLNHPLALGDRLAKMVPDKPVGISLRETYAAVPDFRRAFESDPAAKDVITLAGWMEGFVRSEGVHAAGVVIWDRPLESVMPLQKKGDEEPLTTSYEMKYVEKMGALKMDFLGLRNLDIIDRAIEIVRHTEGIELDPYDIPLDDAGTYEMLSRGEAIGVFQLESAGMREALRLIKPTEFTDIIALVALYRPGPMDYIPSYAARKQGREPVEYLDPRLEKITGETYGICVFQEQLMQTAKDVAGFTPGEADTLRKAIGKKDQELMASLKPAFISGAAKSGVAKMVAEQMWSDNEKAGDYSFNKSHAACYAQLAYATAYLKHNHPAAYMAALMTWNSATKDKVPLFITESRRMGLKVLPPDINRSLRDFAVMEVDGWESLSEADKARTERFEILFGLGAVNKVGDKVISVIRSERDANGPYRSLQDLITRLPDLNKGVLEQLVKAGAFDCFGAPRKAMVDAVPQIIEARKKAVRAAEKEFSGRLVLAVQEALNAGPEPDPEQGGTLFEMAVATASRGGAKNKVTTPQKRGLEALALSCLSSGVLPTPAKARATVVEALVKEDTRRWKAALRKEGLPAEEIEAEASRRVAEGDAQRAEQADELSRLALPALESILASRAEGDLESALAEMETPISSEEWDELTLLNIERETLGFYASAHPLDSSMAQWRRYASHAVAGLTGDQIGSVVTVVGAVTAERILRKKTGERFGLEVMVEDPTGSLPVTFFNDNLDEADAPMLAAGSLVAIKAKVVEDTFKGAKKDAESDSAEDGDEAAKAIKLNGLSVSPWKPDQVDLTPVKPLEIVLPPERREPRVIAQLNEILDGHPGGSSVIVVIDGKRHRLQKRVQIGPALEREVSSLISVG